MPVATKICGLSTPETIGAAVRLGASHIGLVHFATSPRHVSIEQAAALRQYVPSSVKTVLLLVNASPELTIQAIETVRPDVVQFHGNEAAEWLKLIKQTGRVEVWKALGVRGPVTLANSAAYIGAADRLLFDAPAQALPGGTGTSFDWSILKSHDHKIPWALAGGLTPNNVADAVRITGALMVDTSSGVESAPGIKDVDKMAAFLKAAAS